MGTRSCCQVTARVYSALQTALSLLEEGWEILPDQATVMVDYQGEARALADALILNPYDNFGINIYEVLDKKIKLELVPG